MPIIFGKKSSIPGACGVCARRAGPYGVTNLKYSKIHEIMWVCNDCIDRGKWERIYSMSSVKLTEIEERCIGIAASEIRYEILIDLGEYLLNNDFCRTEKRMTNQNNAEIQEIVIKFAKKLLIEYQNQLKKYNN